MTFSLTFETSLEYCLKEWFMKYLNKILFCRYNAEFFAGGSVQNTLRVAEWVIKKPNVCTYFGCVGNDDYAKILKERAMYVT